MKSLRFLLIMAAGLTLFYGCKKKDAEHKLIFKFVFDPTQARLNNFGVDTPMVAGHAGQNPSFNKMSAHYIELAATQFTMLGTGVVLYRAAETTAGGSNAIDFDQSTFAGNNQTFFEIPLKEVAVGDYDYLRVSLAYENFDVNLYLDTIVNVGGTNYPIQADFPCTVASFVGFNTYINSYQVKNQSIAVNGNRSQGYWGFESVGTYNGYPYNYLTSGSAPVGATTVPNPLFASSPIPAGSCVVTGPFSGGKLHITGNETNDVVVTVSLSTNKSFEWVEVVNDGKWEPSKGENIVDMGLRGMIPSVQY